MRFVSVSAAQVGYFESAQSSVPRIPAQPIRCQFCNGNLAPNQQAKNIIANEGYAGLFGHSAENVWSAWLGFSPAIEATGVQWFNGIQWGVALDFIHFSCDFPVWTIHFGAPYMDPRHLDSPSPSFRQGRGFKDSDLDQRSPRCFVHRWCGALVVFFRPAVLHQSQRKNWSCLLKHIL